MARPRVLVASPHAQAVVAMTTILEGRGYRVGHVFDLSVAVARAEIELIDALVLQLDTGTPQIVRAHVDQCPRVGIVFVSTCTRVATACALMDLEFVPQPYTSSELASAVYRAVAWSRARRSRRTIPVGLSSGTHRIHRVVIVAPNPATGQVVTAVVRQSLGAKCAVVSNLAEARLALEQPVDCVLAATDCVFKEVGGADFMRELFGASVPLVPLETDGEDSPQALAEAAWKAIPQLREALNSTVERPSQAG